MIVRKGILCEILFIDDKSGTPTSLIGRIEENQFEEFNENRSNFISFVESYNPPILKDSIEEIIVYDDDDGMSYRVEHGRLERSRVDSYKSKAKVW